MERTKVVIRKLPPSIADADVRELVDSTNVKYNWFNFVQGKTRCTLLSHILSALHSMLQSRPHLCLVKHT